MSKATTSGMGKGGLLLRLILSILLVFPLLGTVGSAVGVSVLCGPCPADLPDAPTTMLVRRSTTA